MQTPKISIIIPVYNLENYILKCLDSVLKQTFLEYEVLIVNDGSIDNSEKVISEFVKINNRFFLFTKHNEGVAIARQFAINKAKGDYLFFLDGDDYIPENSLEILYHKVKETNADIVRGNYTVVDDNNRIVKKENIKKGLYDKNEYIKKLIEDSELYLCFNLIRKSLFESLYLPEEITLGEDAILITQLIEKSNKIVKIDDFIYNYYRRQDSVTVLPKKQNLISAYSANEYIFNFVNEKFNFNKKEQTLNNYRLRQLLQYITNIKITGLYRNDVFRVLNENKIYFVLNPNKIKFKELIALKIAYVNIYVASFFINGYNNIKRSIYKLITK